MIPQISEDEAKERIVRRIANEFAAMSCPTYVNLGVGIPTMVANYVTNPYVFLQAENGMLGVGPLAEAGEADDQLINAGRQLVLETPGCSYFDSALSFGMIRGGHIDATVIGAFEVDEDGNIANWIMPNGKQLGVGGAMDLVTGAKSVIIAMQHTTRNGQAKIVKCCQLPVTAFGELDLLVTELACFRFKNGSLILTEMAAGLTVEDIQAVTEAKFHLDPALMALKHVIPSE